MSDKRPDHEAAVDLARRALAAAERNRDAVDPESIPAGELAVLDAYDKAKAERTRATIEATHKPRSDRGDDAND